MTRSILCAVVAAASLLNTGDARAVGLPAPGAVTPQTVKLPDGPGSVRGLASDASVSSFTGQVAYEIPIELPGGPGGLGPKLSLSYNGGLGNGPLGIGWTYGQVGVRRSLRLGVPSYTDSDELELMGLSGATLVPIGNGQYRAEGQGNSIRGTAVDGGFELVDSAGTHYRIGTSAASRLTDGAGGTKVAAWYLESVTDVAGHVIHYDYIRPSNNNELYLSAITWAGTNVFKAELSYEVRPDVTVGWRTGFRIVTSQRLKTVKLWAFQALRNTVQLTYDQSFALSRLRTVTVVGADGTASPPTTLTYAAAANVGPPVLLSQPAGDVWSLGNSVSFFDVDHDGAMDLLRVESGNQRYRRNTGAGFGSDVPLGNPPALTMASVRMLDLDGDSGAEMVAKIGTVWRSFQIDHDAWKSVDWPGGASIDLSTVAVADLNGDNRMDALMASGNGISVWMGTANGFGPLQSRPAISTANEPGVTPATVQFPDLNGDGLADAVQLTSTGLLEFRGKGDGTFERVGLILYPWTGTTDTTQLRLGDLDRDGILDLVRIDLAKVYWYRGRPDGTFVPQAITLNRPAGADATTVVGLADVNGNGSTDVVWSSTSAMFALDLAGPTNAGLLAAIDNGLGKVQRFDYTASAQLAWAAEGTATPWVEKMPVSIAVATTEKRTFASGEPDRTSLLSVRDGIYEPAERRFIGFQQSTQTFPGINGLSDTIRIITQYPGRGAERVLRGQVLSSSTQDGAGNVFKLVENQVIALLVDGMPADARLKRVGLMQTQVTTTEPGQTPAVVRTRYQYDGEGRVVEEDRDGRVDSGVALDGDESIIQHKYTAEDATTGVRDLVCEEFTLDGAGAQVTHTQRLYGDATTQAALCQPSKGWAREELGYLAQETRWVSLKQTNYDGDGNAILTMAGGVARTIGYDANHLHPISESVSPAAGQTLTWSAQWDNVAGTLQQVTAPNGISSTMTYDGLGRIMSTAANGAVAHLYYRYNWAAPRPQTETFLFDGDPAVLGPLPATWTPASGWRHIVTIANGAGERILTATQLDSAQWNIGEFRQRDSRGRVTARSSGFSFAGADPSAATPPIGTATQTLIYDPLDRVVDELLATGTHKRVTFHPLAVTVAVDGLAPVQTRLDGQNRTQHTERTVNGLVESVDATYDAAGRILQLSLQNGQVHSAFTYDSLGRLASANDPDVGPRTMQYDDGGRLVQTRNGAGDIVTYGYDGAGRLLTTDGRGVTTRYHYDVPRSAGLDHTGGLLAWVEEPTGSVDFGYDGQGRPDTLQRTVSTAGAALTGREITRYSPSGLTRSVDLGDGVALPIHYDPAGRVSQVEGIWSVESYDAANQPLLEHYANGVTQRYRRDILNRPTQVTVENSGGAFYDVTAHYNAFGVVDSLTDNDLLGLDHSATFGFDGAGRLTAAAMGAYQFSYSYDGLQNLTQRSATGPTQLDILAGSYQYRPEAPRQLSQIVAAGGATLASFTYDGAGRQIQHAGEQLTYDALSHLTRVDGVAGGAVVHQYGYDGNRVSTSSVSGETTWFITPNVVVRGSERDHYVRIGDRQIAKITTSDPQAVTARAPVGIAALSLVGLMSLCWRTRRRRTPLWRPALASTLALLTVATGCLSGFSSRRSAIGTTVPLYFHQTYSAGPELTTDAAGQLHEERRTEPFGAAIDAFHDGAVQTVDYRRDPVNALNKLSDPDTNWSFHGARWLAPETAQWHTPDPPATAPDPAFAAGFWALNPYQYVNQNPVLFWDADGRHPEIVGNTDSPYWKEARTESLVEAAEALVGKLTWSMSGPDDGDGYKITPRSMTVSSLNPTHAHLMPVDNDFAKWIRGLSSAPSESSTMNCWEMVLYAGYKSGVISKSWLQSAHSDAAAAGAAGASKSKYFDALRGSLNWDARTEFRGGDAVPRGNLIFFDGMSHVAISTGKLLPAGEPGHYDHEVISLWLYPLTSEGKFDDKVVRTTVEALRDSANTSHIHQTANPW